MKKLWKGIGMGFVKDSGIWRWENAKLADDNTGRLMRTWVLLGTRNWTLHSKVLWKIKNSFSSLWFCKLRLRAVPSCLMEVCCVWVIDNQAVIQWIFLPPLNNGSLCGILDVIGNKKVRMLHETVLQKQEFSIRGWDKDLPELTSSCFAREPPKFDEWRINNSRNSRR